MTPIIKWEPFEPFSDMDNFFEDFWAGKKAKGFSPAIDIYEKKDHIVAETPLAGVDPNDVEILVENDVLTIQGKTKKESEVDEKDYYRKEVRSGSFYRSIPLPAHVKGENAEAEFSDGMLTITIPKSGMTKSKPIRIAIKKGKK